jgi:DNA anti-recombination protein RmuC
MEEWIMSHDFRVTVGRNAGTIHTVSNGFFFFEVYGDKDEAQKVCDKLNSILDENEQLKQQIQRERTVSTKQHLKWSKEAEEQIQTLQEENEHIKTTIQNMLDTERTELGQSVLKQLWEAIQ